MGGRMVRISGRERLVRDWEARRFVRGDTTTSNSVTSQENRWPPIGGDDEPRVA